MRCLFVYLLKRDINIQSQRYCVGRLRALDYNRIVVAVVAANEKLNIPNDAIKYILNINYMAKDNINIKRILRRRRRLHIAIMLWQY